MLRAMSKDGKGLHELTEGFQSFPQILVNVEVKVKQPFDEVPPIQKAAREVESDLGANGRLLLRYSGTEPLARIMIEGESQDEIEKLRISIGRCDQANAGGLISTCRENFTLNTEIITRFFRAR